MKKYLTALAVLVMCTGCISQVSYDKMLKTYEGSKYCQRMIDDPPKSDFKGFNLIPRSKSEIASDCDSIYSGDAKMIRACKIQRCDTFNAAGH